MKKSKFAETQIISIRNDAEAGVPVKEVCRKHRMLTCYYQWNPSMVV